MINSSEMLTGGFHCILFGKYKPDRVLESYEQNQAEGDFYHHPDALPSTPGAYLSLHESIRSRWVIFFDDYKNVINEWLPPFYALPVKPFNAFHILCDFYSFFIRAECRMMIQVSEEWKVHLAISTLKYELLTLRNELLELLRETAHRLKKHHSNTPKGNLNRFVLELLQNNLLITFFEVQKRSAHLLENKLIPKRELFLKYLKQPEPQVTPWYRTPALTRFELEFAMRKSDRSNQLRSVEQYLHRVRKEMPGDASQIRDSINLLENVWFCLFIMNKSDIWATADLNNPEECSKCIDEIHHQLYQISGNDNRADTEKIVQIVIHSFDRVQSFLISENTGEPSSAGRLVRSIEFHYDSNAEKLTGSDGMTAVREPHASSILDQYIPVDQLQEKLDVSLKSLNHYLSKSNTPVQKFSNKTRLIHTDDLKAMMDYFKSIP